MMSDDYWCYHCQTWLDEDTVMAFNDEYWGNDDAGPEICPECLNEVVWWSSPAAQAIRYEQGISPVPRSAAGVVPPGEPSEEARAFLARAQGNPAFRGMIERLGEE